MATKLLGKQGSALLSKIGPKISGMADKLKGKVTSKIGSIASGVKNKVASKISSKFPKLAKFGSNFIKHAGKEMTPKKFGQLAQAIVGKDAAGKSLKAFDRIKTGLKAVMPEKYVAKLKGLVVNKIKGKAGKVFNAVKEKGLAKFNSVKDKVLNKLGIKLGSGGGKSKIGSLISGAKNKLSGLKNTIGSKLGSLKNTVSSKVGAVKDKVGALKNKLGGMFKGKGGSAKPSKLGSMLSNARGKLGGMMSKGKEFAGKVAKTLEIPTTKAKFMSSLKKNAIKKLKEKATPFVMEKLKGWFGGNKKKTAKP